MTSQENNVLSYLIRSSPSSYALRISPLVMISILRSSSKALALAEIGVRRDAVMVNAVKARLMGVNMVETFGVIDR